ncbi:MAG: hypothetical protein AAGF84_06630 [Planctomycetota bacterium]
MDREKKINPVAVLWYLRFALPIFVFVLPLAVGRSVTQAAIVFAIVAGFLFWSFIEAWCEFVTPIGLFFAGVLAIYTKPGKGENSDQWLLAALGVASTVCLAGIVTLLVR